MKIQKVIDTFLVDVNSDFGTTIETPVEVAEGVLKSCLTEDAHSLVDSTIETWSYDSVTFAKASWYKSGDTEFKKMVMIESIIPHGLYRATVMDADYKEFSTEDK